MEVPRGIERSLKEKKAGLVFRNFFVIKFEKKRNKSGSLSDQDNLAVDPR